MMYLGYPLILQMFTMSGPGMGDGNQAIRYFFRLKQFIMFVYDSETNKLNAKITFLFRISNLKILIFSDILDIFDI